MTNEEIIANFLKPPPEGAYTDERLAMLLAHAQDGRLSFYSCCCLLGVPTADHALKGRASNEEFFITKTATHLQKARDASGDGGNRIENAFKSLGYNEANRRAKLIPLIEAEIKRRESLRQHCVACPSTEIFIRKLGTEDYYCQPCAIKAGCSEAVALKAIAVAMKD